MKTSVIGLGTGFRRGINKDSSKIIEAALDRGINLIDTAEIYEDGLSEKVVGRTIKGRREEVVLVTKVSGDHLKSAEGSLKRLDTDFIDLYLVHWPNVNVPLGETLRAMERLVNEGKVRHIGVSNFNVKQMKKANEELSRCQVVANEVKYNLLERQIENEVVPFCQKEDIAVLAYSPLAKGLLTGRFKEENSIPEDDWRNGDWFFEGESLKKGVKMVEVLKDIGTGYGKTRATLYLEVAPPICQPFSSHTFLITGLRLRYSSTTSLGTRFKRQEKLTHLEHVYFCKVQKNIIKPHAVRRSKTNCSPTTKNGRG